MTEPKKRVALPPLVRPKTARDRRLQEVASVRRERAAQSEGTTIGLPPLPRLPKNRSQPRPCLCGCGSTTRGGRFMPGHDARLYGFARRVESGKSKLTEIPAESRKAVQDLLKTGIKHG